MRVFVPMLELTPFIKNARVLTQFGLFSYLLATPLSHGFPAWIRELLLITILAGMILNRIPRPSDSERTSSFSFLVPLVFFSVSMLLSIIFSEFPMESIDGISYAPISFLFFLATQEVVIDKVTYRYIFCIFATMVILLGLDGSYQFWTSVSLFNGSPLFRGRVTGSLPNPNDLALIPILLPLVLSLVATESSVLVRALIFLGLPFAIITVILSESRNAWLGLAVGFGSLIALSRQRKLVLVSVVSTVALFTATVVLDIGKVSERAKKIFDVSSDPRIGQWLVAWQMFTEAPFLGKGIHTFGRFYLLYLPKIQLPPHVIPDIAYIPWAHNLYLEMLSERGLIGLTSFLILVLTMIRQLAMTLNNEDWTEVRAYAVGLFGSLLVFLSMGLFDLTFLKDWVALVFWLLAALIARLSTVTSADTNKKIGLQ